MTLNSDTLYSPMFGLPFLILMAIVFAWAMWETGIRDHVVPKVKYFFGLQKFKRSRKINLKALKKYAMDDLAATQEIFRIKKGPRHIKERRPRNRIPRHSATIAY